MNHEQLLHTLCYDDLNFVGATNPFCQLAKKHDKTIYIDSNMQMENLEEGHREKKMWQKRLIKEHLEMVQPVQVLVLLKMQRQKLQLQIQNLLLKMQLQKLQLQIQKLLQKQLQNIHLYQISKVTCSMHANMF